MREELRKLAAEIGQCNTPPSVDHSALDSVRMTEWGAELRALADRPLSAWECVAMLKPWHMRVDETAELHRWNGHTHQWAECFMGPGSVFKVDAALKTLIAMICDNYPGDETIPAEVRAAVEAWKKRNNPPGTAKEG